MNCYESKLLSRIRKTFFEITAESPRNFAGFGLVICDEDFLKNGSFLPLRPSIAPPDSLYIGTEEASAYLCEITCADNHLHDGYIFINKNGLITHVAQFVETKIDKDIAPHQEHGTRYLNSKLISKIKGVKFVVNLATSFQGFVFIDGKDFSLEEKTDD